MENGRIVFGPDETTVPRVRMNLFASEKAVMRSVHFSYAQTATNEFTKIFDGLRVFENPKHFEDIKSLIAYLHDSKNAIVLDFFSGSATTAHAVMQLNAEDQGNRRFIMVQLPETTDENSEAHKAGYQNICEIGKERIRRVGAQIKENAGLLADDLDTGFRVFKLDSSNLKQWDDSYVTAENQASLFDRMESMFQPAKPGRTDEDILYEIFLKYGIELTTPFAPVEIDGKTFYAVGKSGYLFICLDEGLTVETVEQTITYTPDTMIFARDSFIDANEITNTVQVLEKHKIEFRWI
ncbi:MAG: site-specific DNA-methyltransferase [Christensenellaceae bacterium]